MSFRVKASTIAFTAAAACLLLAPTAMASSRAPVQVTGKQLKSALLPTSDFLAGYTAAGEHDSGGALRHGSVYKLPSVSCKVFWLSLGLADIAPGFGQTAYAGNIVSGGSASVPYQVLQQSVDQFASTKTASSFFSQLSAKFRSCPSLSESDTKGGTLRFTVHSRSAQHVGGHQALQVVEHSADSTVPGVSTTSDLLWTIDGTDIYMLSSELVNANSPQPSLSSLTLKLIARVGALR
jgi:PknH-like extracellular domain